MNLRNKKLNLLGLAMRAGKIISGESLVLKEVRMRKASVVILANDASENTKKKISDKCSFYGVPVIDEFSTEEMSRAIGKERVVCALTDAGFSAKLRE